MPGSLQAKLAAARKRWRSIQTGGGAALVFSLLTVLVFLSYYSDRLMALSTSGRAGWLAALVLSLIAGVAFFVIRPLKKPLPDTEIATQVERKFPALGERLLTTIELAGAGSGGGGMSVPMIRSLATETERLAAPLNFGQAISTEPLKKPVIVATLAALGLFGQIALAPEAMLAWAQRILNPGADIPVFSSTKVIMSPGDTVVPRGEDVEIGVRLGGVLTDRANLVYRVGNGRWQNSALKAVAGDGAGKQFQFKMTDLQQDVTLYAQANDGRANPRTIRVEDRPTILKVNLKLNYPAYTGRPAELISATAGNIVAPVGTRVEMTAVASKPLKSAVLKEEGRAPVDCKLNGDTVQSELTVAKDKTYSLSLSDKNGFSAAPPPQYTIRAQADQAPTVQILKPNMDLERTPDAIVDLQIQATDDYGVNSLQLVSTVGSKTRSTVLPVSARPNPRTLQSASSLNLASLGLKAGDTLVYEAAANDNDVVTGPHVGKSSTYRITIIGAKEMRERIDAAVAQEREAMKQLLDSQKAAQKLLKEARQKNDMGAMERAQQAQRSLAQDSQSLAQKMQQTTRQMQENKLSTPNEQKRREMNEKALDQLSKNEMPKAADTIQKAQQQAAERANLSKDAENQQEQIKRQLEQLNNEANPEANPFQLAQQAEDLAKEQQKLSDESQTANAQMDNKPESQMTPQEKAKLNEIAKRQQELKDKTAALEDKVKRAAQDAKERGKAEAKVMEQASKQQQKAGTQQKQQGAQKDLQKGQPSDASQKQSDAAKDLQEMANQLDRAGQQQEEAKGLEQKAEKLDQLADKLTTMANEQAQIARRVAERPDPAAANKLAEMEKQLNDRVKALRPETRSVPQVEKEIGKAMDQLQQSESLLKQNNSPAATPNAREATAQLRRAAQAALEAAEQIQQQLAAQEGQKELEKLAAEQRQIQKQTKQLDAGRQPNTPPTNDQKQKAQELAKRQQDLIQKSQKAEEELPSRAFKWALGEANRKMQNAQKGLSQQNSGQDTQRNQEQAAQTLERIARSLQQQAQGNQQQQQQQQQGQDSQNSANQQMAQAAGELQLAREMQQQIRQETGNLEQRRNQNPGRNMTAEQQRELNALNQAQRETQRITERAAQQLKSAPEISKNVQKAAEEMDEVQEKMQRQQTGQETQGKQDQIVKRLDQAIGQAQQAMRQQRQQMAQQRQQQQQAQQGQQPGQQGQQPGQQQAQGNNPSSKTDGRVVDAKAGVFGQIPNRGTRFGQLQPREQQNLREGQKERVPAEYRDLVNQYYKALSERSGGGK